MAWEPEKTKMQTLPKCAITAASICALALMSFAGTANAALIDDVTNPGDFIIPIDLDGTSSSPGGETAANAIDNTVVFAKYLNFGGENSGFIVTPSNNPSNVAVTSLTITTANDVEIRDPATFSLWGTNDPIVSLAHSDGSAESWTPIVLDVSLALPEDRNTVGPTVLFANATHYESFRLVFPTLKGTDVAEPSWVCGDNEPCMQIAEIQLNAEAITRAAVPEPAALGLVGLGLVALGFTRRRRPFA